ncbi:S1 family peptidase [Amycolatopsis rhizosphaerae]|uniref:S1 family peptidase n=1 Tax=Amycolatopsis rhizosphaerae TaxID=2053003 RepID=UPI001FEAD999|nr:S1 family peptidase [Amycolatopsis rhizosphaerae]
MPKKRTRRWVVAAAAAATTMAAPVVAQAAPAGGLASGSVTAAADAPAPLKVVTNGMKIVWSPNPGLGLPGVGYCTLGPVGYDRFGNGIGITASHCVQVVNQPPTFEYPVYDANDLAFGPIGTYVWTNPIPAENDPSFPDTPHDYAVIRFDLTKVTLSSNGPALRIDHNATRLPSRYSDIICKDGQTTGLKCGMVGNIVNGMLHSWAINGPGDSGGPVVLMEGNVGTAWAGIVHGVYDTDPLGGTFFYESAQNILTDLAARDGYGAGFTPVDTP